MKLAEKIAAEQMAVINENLETTIQTITEIILKISKSSRSQELSIKIPSFLVAKAVTDWALGEGFQVIEIGFEPPVGLCIFWDRSPAGTIGKGAQCMIGYDGKISVAPGFLLELKEI